MKLTKEQVRHVARLARLEVSDAELPQVEAQLSRILDAFESLATVDTSGVEPTLQLAPGRPAERGDAPSGELGAERALDNAPQRSGTSFAVPRFVE